MDYGKASLTPSHSCSSVIAGHYHVIKDLCHGSFGLVQLIQARKTRHHRVCKTISTATLEPDVLEMVCAEANILRRLDHPNVVKLSECAEDPERHEIMLILEHIPGGSCAELLQNALMPLEDTLVARIARQVLVAVAYCHAQGVSHRDLKPEHVMLMSRHCFRTTDCKLIDFGFATPTSHGMLDFVGTPEYMAPEVVCASASDTSKTDIWSIGVTTIELLTGISPFGRPSDYSSSDPVYVKLLGYSSFGDVEKSLQGVDVWESRGGVAHDFVKRLLAKDPQHRMTATNTLGHPWMQEHQAVLAGLSDSLVQSMTSYVDADPLIRCCLLAVAAQMDSMELAGLSDVFLSLDSDCDGKITGQDLAETLAKRIRPWWQKSDLWTAMRSALAGDSNEPDLAHVARSACLDHNGGLSFTEFTAACLYARNDTKQSLVNLAFEALDDDQDGWIQVHEIFTRFEALGFSLGPTLSQDKRICLSEWRRLFDSDFTRTMTSKAPCVDIQRKGCGLLCQSAELGEPMHEESF